MIAWMKRWGGLALVVVAAGLGLVLFGAFSSNQRKPVKKIKRELEVMKAGTEARAAAIETSAEEAIVAIEAAEEKTIAELDEKRTAEYKALRESGDAERVMRHLERYADPSRRERYKRRAGDLRRRRAEHR